MKATLNTVAVEVSCEDEAHTVLFLYVSPETGRVGAHDVQPTDARTEAEAAVRAWREQPTRELIDALELVAESWEPPALPGSAAESDIVVAIACRRQLCARQLREVLERARMRRDGARVTLLP